MKKIRGLHLFAFCFAFSSCALFGKGNATNPGQKPGGPTVDTAGKKNSDSINNLKPKPFKDVVPSNAAVSKGLFTVYRTASQRYFFSVPDSLLDKDILLVSRIAKGAADYHPLNGMAGFGGDEIGERVIHFTKATGDRLVIQTISYWERSNDSSANGMFRTVANSGVLPIAWAFNIKAYTPDSTASVIDVTDFFNSDNDVLYFSGLFKKWVYDLGALVRDRSYIMDVRSFPLNVELRKINTYEQAEEGTLTYELNASFVLLPKDPMKPRSFDERVGYWRRVYMDFDKPQGVGIASMITRWRLEPKEEDKEKYLRGELVEPKKPIVYYIDPATPQKWVPYLIQGVNAWQKAFEKAGFKNAVYALPAPVGDSNFSVLDARHNVIVYKASQVANASGPSIHDPRTAEILETHINWYHNVMQLLHDWYMVQAGPNDPRARKMTFDDSLMGTLIRYVACHEVGHTLGLLHNFGSSSTVPVDSLRSRRYVRENGLCPSVMDYARFNYIAQPEDHFSPDELISHIGPYDEWVIEYGYRWLPQLTTREQEKEYLTKWVTSRVTSDKRLFFGPQFMVTVDPRSQTEDLGDDAMKAGEYGVRNLKIVMQHLKEWSHEPNENYESLLRMYKQVTSQFNRYMDHVANNVRLGTYTSRIADDPGSVFGNIARAKQKRAIAFLNEQLFETPKWLVSAEYRSLVGGPGIFLPEMIQEYTLQGLVSYMQYMRMYNRNPGPEERYTFDELMTDLETEILKELKDHTPIDIYRRNLQKVFIERIIEQGLATPDRDMHAKLTDDFVPTMQAHMRSLEARIEKSLRGYKDDASRNHLLALQIRLKQAASYNPFLLPPPERHNVIMVSALNGRNTEQSAKNGFLDCWSNGVLIPWEKFAEQGKAHQ